MKNYYCIFLKKPWRLILSAVLFFFCCSFLASAQEPHCSEGDVICIDGRAIDWTNLDAAPISTYFHAQDPYEELDDQFTTGAADENFAVNAWTFSQVKNKNNIANGAAVLIGTELYFAGDRITTEGDAMIGFWFFQDGTAPLGVGSPGDKGYFEPVPAEGDLLVLANFTNGGRSANTVVYSVESYNYDNKGNIISWNFKEETGTGAAAAQNNDMECNVPAGWDYPTATYPMNAFYEGYVDLSSIIGEGEEVNLCIGSFMLETRSSASLTASLDDFVGGPFSTIPEIMAEGDGACYTGEPVEMTLCASSEEEGLTYVWYSDAGLTTQVGTDACLTVNVTETANFWVVATNEIGCDSETAVATAEVWPNPECSIESFGNVTFYQGDDGYINLSVSGGKQPYTYLWTTMDGSIPEGQETSQNLTDLTAGNYMVLVTDANGCTTICEQLIEAPAFNPTCLAEGSHIGCFGGTDGVITVSWSDFPGNVNIYLNDELVALDVETSPYDITGLTAGNYTVYIEYVDDPSVLNTECSDEVTQEPEKLIVLNCGIDTEVGPCISEETLATSFAGWLAGFTVSGGTEPLVIVYTVNGEEVESLDGVDAPDICGGSVTISIDVTDACELNETCEGTFTVEAAPEVTVETLPQDAEYSACDFTEQSEVEAAFAAWVALQETNLNLGGGCNPQLSSDAGDVVLNDFCLGDTVTVTWTVTDLCISDIVVSADFMISAAPEVTYDILPQDEEVSACDFTEQSEVEAAFAAWVALQETNLNLGGGCNPQLSSDADQVVLADFCEGDEVTVTWTITDLCIEPIEASATFTITAATPIEAYCSSMTDIVCASEEEIDMLFAEWKAGFGYTGGCPDAEDNMADLEALVWSDYIDAYSGGTISFTYVVWDGCSRDEVTCEFTVLKCVCETAFAKGDDAICFMPEYFNKWGWTNPIEPGSYTWDLWAAAGQCDTGKGTLVGTVTVNYVDGYVIVDYDLFEGYKLDESHVYAGYDKFQQVKQGKKTVSTVAPGSFKNEGPFEGPIYVIVHAVVCGNYPDEYMEEPYSDGGVQSLNLKSNSLKVYPNPFSSKVNFEFVSQKDARARLEITNALGQRVAVLMDENVRKGVMNRVEYTPVDVVSGILIYRLILDENVSTGRLLYKQ